MAFAFPTLTPLQGRGACWRRETPRRIIEIASARREGTKRSGNPTRNFAGRGNRTGARQCHAGLH
jgi:hypothetical protein